MSQPWEDVAAGLVHEILDKPDWLKTLSKREAKLLDGALAFHCLLNPGRVLQATVLQASPGEFPVLTGPNTSRIEWPDDRQVIGHLNARPLVHDLPDDPESVDVVIDLGGEPASRFLPQGNLPAPVRAAWHGVRVRMPVAFDALRQARTDQVERKRAQRSLPRAARPPASSPSTPAGDRPKAVLFGVHWFQLGGAEHWAAETIQLAREAGFLPIVISDRPSGHNHIDRPAFDGTLVLPLTVPLEDGQDARLIRELFARFDIRGVHLHHCSWLYERLPWIRAHFPDTQIVDSLHVLEWRTGGFVDIALRMSDVMDAHHVISPQLRDYLVDRGGLPREKVALATLADLTVTPADSPPPARRTADSRFTVAFVGRLTQQKRPYLFLRLAKRLVKHSDDRFRFVMHGDGELAAEVHAYRARLGLEDVVELRGPDVPVAVTLDEADALVICSDNEGITLTSFEADAHDTLVVSADVGSQASVVVPELLCPRAPLAFLRAAESRIVQLADSPALAEQNARAQRTRMRTFGTLPRARDWTRALYERWAS